MHFAHFFPTSPILLTFTLLFANSIAQHPPKLIESPGGGHLETKRVAFAGSSILLPCLVDKSNDDLFIDWTKDGDSITNIDSRIKQTNSGSLKLRELLPEDTGFYLCKAVNGFGSVEVGINLIVLENDVSEANRINDTKLKESELRPRIVQVSPPSDEVIQREVGSSVRLKCESSGKPKPTINWFHNHNMIQASREESRKGRWTLVIYDLKLEDSGNYSCFIVNPFGNVSSSFILDVVDRARNKPQFSSHHPQNTTITEGGNASFQCHVKSIGSLPDIQWLKRVNFFAITNRMEQAGGDVQESSLIEVDGQWYRVLPSSISILTRESKDIYSSRLMIENVKLEDEGEYCCVLTDGLDGIERAKKAFLTVIPKVIPIAYVPQINQSILTESPFPVVIAGVALFFLVIFIAFVMVHCRYRKQQSSSIASSIGSNHSFQAPSDSPSFNHGKHFPPLHPHPEVPLDLPSQMNPILNGKNRRNPVAPYGPPPMPSVQHLQQRNSSGLIIPSSPRHQVSADRNSSNMNLHTNQPPFPSHHQMGSSSIHSSPHHGPNYNRGSGMNNVNSPVIPAYSSVPIFTNSELKTVPSSPRHQIRSSATAAQSYQQSFSEGKGSISSYHSNHSENGGPKHGQGVSISHGAVEESAHYDYSTINYGYFC